MDIRDKKPVWKDQDVFDIPESAGITSPSRYLEILRNTIVNQINHLTLVSQMIPDLQKEISILEMYIGGYISSDKQKIDRWKTDLITKANEIDHLKARKEILIVSINALQTIMESVLWEIKES